MKILDLQTGRIHEYGEDGHDSLVVSEDGRTLSYYNLQCGDGSRLGDYRFVCDDNKVPEESQTADALHCEVYFNIGGWHTPHGEWIKEDEVHSKCSLCGFKYADYRILFDYCPNCGADMRGDRE